MITKNTFIIFIQLLTFCFSQSINIGSKTLEIGMDKKGEIDYLSNIIKPDVSVITCLLYTSPSPRDTDKSRMPSSA